MDFDDFYTTSFDRVRRAMTLTFRDPQLAEDVTQEAFYRALRKWPKISQHDHPEGWTMLTALNAGRDVARRRNRHQQRAPMLTDNRDSEVGHKSVEDRMLVTDLLARLSDRQREALLLRYISQLTIPEIAHVMGCAEGTVKSTLHSAIANASQIRNGAFHDSN
jgi:RNA polymerase sigma-70 factor (ECF subfamily)